MCGYLPLGKLINPMYGTYRPEASNWLQPVRSVSSHKEHSYCCRVLPVVGVIACGLFLIFKMTLWLIRGVGTAWSDEETDYNYKRLLGPEQSMRLTATRASLSGVYVVVNYDYVRSRLDLLVAFSFFLTIGFKCPWMWLTILSESQFLSCVFLVH